MSHIGIEIGGTKLQIAEGNAEGGVIRRMHRLDVVKEHGSAGILRQIEDTLRSLDVSPSAVGIGFGGPVDRRSGKIAASHQIGGWSGFDIGKWFRDHVDIPVFLENDANTAALAEARYGAGKDHDLVFYITLGSGVGGGMVINKALYHGAVPGEAEVGLLTMDRDGRTLESFCSGWALDAMIRDRVGEDPNSILRAQVRGHGGEAKFLSGALQMGDELAHQILVKYADTLAWGLSHVVHLFNPEIIILGGGVSLIGMALRDAVERSMQKYIMKTFAPGPAIKLSSLGEEVVPRGALSLIQTS